MKNCSTVSNPLRTNIPLTPDALQNIFKLLMSQKLVSLPKYNGLDAFSVGTKYRNSARDGSVLPWNGALSTGNVQNCSVIVRKQLVPV
jgi:hypothetical protein